MKRMLEMFGGFAIATLAACSSNPVTVEIEPASTASIDVRSEVGNRFHIRVGEVAEIGDGRFRIAFRGVTNDSRCPEDVTCVWAGDATLHLGFSLDRADWSWATLHTGVEPMATRHGDLTITVVGLAPGNRTGQAIGSRDYVAELRVDRN